MAVSKISKDTIVKDYSVTTVANEYVSPFGAYYQMKYSDVSVPTGYKAVNATLFGEGSTNPAICKLYTDDGQCFIYSHSPVTLICRVVYQKI